MSASRVSVCDDQILFARFDEMTLLFVEYGEALGDDGQVRIEAGNLFIDGDGFGRKALLAVMVCDELEALDGVLRFFGARVEIAERIERAIIVRVALDDAAILGDSRWYLALSKILLSRTDSLCFIESHRENVSCPRRA